MELKEVKWGFCNLYLFLYKSERSTSRKIFLFKSERSTSSKNKTQQALYKREHQTYCTDKINPKRYARKKWSYNPPSVPLQWKWATQRLNALRIIFFVNKIQRLTKYHCYHRQQYQGSLCVCSIRALRLVPSIWLSTLQIPLLSLGVPDRFLFEVLLFMYHYSVGSFHAFIPVPLILVDGSALLSAIT